VNPIVSFPGEGETFHLEAGSLARFKVFSRETEEAFEAFEVFEREVPPHTIGADPHLHRNTKGKTIALSLILIGQALQGVDDYSSE
jgi:hypothetical protein